jgi:outer membrane protein OmpA-like peptidoglycan-associated protein
MRRTAFLPLCALLIVSLCFFSCVPQKKVNADKKQLEKLDSQLVQHSTDLKKLDEKRQYKETQNEIDSAANSRIKKFIDNTNLEIDTLHKQNTIHIGEAVINKEDWDRLRAVLSRTRSAQQRIEQKISFLEDLINRNMVVKLEQDVLFEPGSYSVSPTVVRNMTKIFEPAVLEIDRFTKKYPDFPLSLVITFKGYADATTIGEGSSLYNNLRSRLALSGREPDNKELNKELSRARAESVRNLFKDFAASRSDNGIYIRNVLYLYEGKGESLPDPKQTDYRLDDPRRRVVLLFWSIFPD